MMRALITGVCGQDGSYLADILLTKGYEVHGLYRHSSKVGLQNVQHNLDNPKFVLHQGDVTDALCLDRVIHSVDPHEIYHEADQDNVDWSYKFPAYQMEVTVKAVSNLLESVRSHCPSAKVFIPCSATMFGDAPAPQNENTPFNPRSPYACAKVAAYHIARKYLENYGFFIVTCILYNHYSPRRNGNYLLHKICKAAAHGLPLSLFDPHQDVQIGYAKDYMQLVVKLMQVDESSDYVVSYAPTWKLDSLVAYVQQRAGSNVEVMYKLSKCSYRSPTLYGDNTKLHMAVPVAFTSSTHEMIDEVINKYRREQCV